MPDLVKHKRLALLALLALRAGVAEAHPEVSPQHVNRYLSLIVVGDRVEFFVTLLYGALPGAPERKALDTDGDGRIGEPERLRGQATWQRRAGELGTVAIDDVPVPLAGATADLQLGTDATAGPAPLVVEVYGSRPIAPGTRRLRLAAGWDPPRLGETELVLDLAQDWELVASRQGDGADEKGGAEEKLGRYRFDGAGRPQDRAATFVVRRAAGTPPRPASTIVAVVVGVLALAGLALEVARRINAARTGSRSSAPRPEGSAPP